MIPPWSPSGLPALAGIKGALYLDAQQRLIAIGTSMP
jgi:hypothetical protein